MKYDWFTSSTIFEFEDWVFSFIYWGQEMKQMHEWFPDKYTCKIKIKCNDGLIIIKTSETL